MLQAFVVDLFSPHDGSIDLRVLSECFLESDFVENEVSKKIILCVSVHHSLPSCPPTTTEKGRPRNRLFSVVRGQFSREWCHTVHQFSAKLPWNKYWTPPRKKSKNQKTIFCGSSASLEKKTSSRALWLCLRTGRATSFPKKKIKDTRLAIYIHIYVMHVCVCVCVRV